MDVCVCVRAQVHGICVGSTKHLLGTVCVLFLFSKFYMR